MYIFVKSVKSNNNSRFLFIYVNFMYGNKMSKSWYINFFFMLNIKALPIIEIFEPHPDLYRMPICLTEPSSTILQKNILQAGMALAICSSNALSIFA